MESKDKAQFFPQPFGAAPCDSFNCTSRAAYMIGRPDGPLSICHRVCQKCAEDIARSIPDELRHLTVPEGMVLVENREIEAVKELKEQLAKVKPSDGTVLVDEAWLKCLIERHNGFELECMNRVKKVNVPVDGNKSKKGEPK